MAFRVQALVMTVHNTTGVNTLFIYVATILTSAAYAYYCAHTGSGNANGRLVRAGAWCGVDISMVLNALLRPRGATSLMRMQTCTPPMPTQKEVYDYLDSWYENHKFEHSVLVFVFDGRRCPRKKRNVEARRKREKAAAARDSARTLKRLEKALKQLVTVDADVLFWTRQWVTARNLNDKVLFVGAPYEADAQLVQLERDGIIDVIISGDGT